MQVASPAPKARRFGAFELDLRAGELRKNGFRIRLQEQPFQVLQVLLEHPGEVVTREELQTRIWPSDTFVDFEHGLNNAIKRLRETLGDSAERPRFIETRPRRGYRFIAPIDGKYGEASSVSDVSTHHVSARRRFEIIALGLLAGTALTAVLAWTAFSRFRRPRLLRETDTIVVADFDNRTGDPVFDDTLKRALSAQIEQSPFFNVLSEDRVQETLRLMGRPLDAYVSEGLAREICQRTGSGAVLNGSIATLGSEFAIALAATDCRTGDSLAQEQAQADRKEDVLKALDGLSGKLRRRMGESLSSIQRFNTPIEQATTPSLEALKAYSLGWQTQPEKGNSEAIPLFEHAVELDPNFAMAYAGLGGCYVNLQEPTIASPYFAKAFELRNHVSEREKFFISAHYYEFVTGELPKAIQTYQLWKQTYPRDVLAFGNLANDYISVGDYEKSVAESLDALGLKSYFGPGAVYANLIQAYAALDRFEQARATFQKATADKISYPLLHGYLYYVAFSQSDTAEMEQQAAWAVGRSGVEDFQLSAESDTEAFFGHLEKARKLSELAVESARRNNLLEAGALWQVNSALREAEFGNIGRARQLATVALAIAPGRDVQVLAALARARAGETARAHAAADKLSRQFPENTAMKFYWLPAIRAAIEIGQGKHFAALEHLQIAAPYDLASPPPFQLGSLFPVYLRGQAFLISGQGVAAANEFQKILDHRGIVLNFPFGALAHLGLARAYASQGDIHKSRAAYEDFLALWKNADRDIPILRAARSEYARLK